MSVSTGNSSTPRLTFVHTASESPVCHVSGFFGDVFLSSRLPMAHDDNAGARVVAAVTKRPSHLQPPSRRQPGGQSTEERPGTDRSTQGESADTLTHVECARKLTANLFQTSNHPGRPGCLHSEPTSSGLDLWASTAHA